MKSGLCECFKGALKGPCKHKALVAHQYKMKNFEILPKENEKMRAFYHFLGTGIEHESSWFRPLLEEEDIPQVDWNDNLVSNENENETEQMSVESNTSSEQVEMNMSDSKSESESQSDDESNEEIITRLKKSLFCFIYKIQNRIDKDKQQYTKAVDAFIKQCDKISDTNDAVIQKVLFTFAKDVVQTVKKGKKKNSGQIPVQNTAKSRRKVNHRGSGPSQMGRPSNEQSLQIQLLVESEDEILSHSQPKKKKEKPKHPHNLSASVAANRAAEKKH